MAVYWVAGFSVELSYFLLTRSLKSNGVAIGKPLLMPCHVTNAVALIPDPGLEPGPPHGEWILNPSRLPFRQSGNF